MTQPTQRISSASPEGAGDTLGSHNKDNGEELMKKNPTLTMAALSLSALLFTAACSSEAGSPNVDTDPASQSESPSQADSLPPNGTVYEPLELYPPAVEGEFGYLNLGDIGEARLLASIAGEEDPGLTPGSNFPIKNGEPIPDIVKEEIEQRYFQQGVRMFAIDSKVRRDADYHFDMYSFLTRTAGPLDRLSELSGTYVDIVFSRKIFGEELDYYVGTRVWDTIHFEGYTETLEEYLANYEEWLGSEGITDYELWVMEPEVTP